MILRILFLALCCWFLSVFALKQTEGFTLSKLGMVFLEETEESFDESFLSTPFTYLGKGGQSYVFLSEDGSRVIKFLRGSKRRHLQLFSPLLSREKKERKILAAEEKMRQTLQSYAIARDSFRKETGILATHLTPSCSIASKITLIDRSNIRHSMDPNCYPFIIQKRATLVKETIAQLMERNEVAAAKTALRDLFSLLKLRIERGIDDGDPNFAKNFGFLDLDLEPIQIDGGSFHLSSSPSLSFIQHSKEDLQHWINASYPELSEDFDRAYEEFITEVL